MNTFQSVVAALDVSNDSTVSNVQHDQQTAPETKALSLLTLNMLAGAIGEAEKRYLSTSPRDKGGNLLTSSADLRKGRKFLTAENVQTAARLLTDAGIDAQALCDRIAKSQPVKATMRMCEFFNALHSGDYKLLDATTVLTILANVRAGAKTRDAIAFSVTGRGDDNTSDQVRSVERIKRLQKLFPKVGAGTEPTQVSRSFGERGFAGDLGIGRFERDAHGQRMLKVNGSNPFYKLVAKLVDKASDATLRTMKGTKDKDAK
jgi:hypothetical protein